MQLIRNLFQTLRYLATASADERIERQISRMRFGLTDAERNEQLRQKKAVRSFWLAMLVMVVALYIIGKLSA